MTRYRLLILLIILPIYGLCDKKIKINEVVNLTHKYQPTIAPCKYGVMKAFDQPHFVPDPIGDFKEEFHCCPMCETLHFVLPGTDVKAKMCCKPESPIKHSIHAYNIGVDKKTKQLIKKPVNSLDLVFHEIVPKPMDIETHREFYKLYKPRTGSGAYGYLFIGAAASQIIICILSGIFWYFTADRIVLECVPDCDYEIEKEVKVYHPSKSLMMSDNMNSDLMSMSVGVN